METGIKGHQETVVTEAMTAINVGSGAVRVFATPMMIALIEKTASRSIEAFLEEGQSSVGTLVNVSHVSATPVGMKVWCDSELVEIDRRRLVFKVSAFDEAGLIGEGLHERFIISKEKFQAKTDSKKASE